MDIHGSGTEAGRLKSKPKTFKLFQFGETHSQFLNSGKRYDRYIDLAAKITRRGSVSTGAGEVCSYGDGTGADPAPKPPDCGTKNSTWYGELNYSSNAEGELPHARAGRSSSRSGRSTTAPTEAARGRRCSTARARRARQRSARRLPTRDLFGSDEQHVMHTARP